MDQFGEEIAITKIGIYNKVLIKSFTEFSRNMQNEEFTMDMFTDWVEEDDRHEEIRQLGLNKCKDSADESYKRVWNFLQFLVRKGSVDTSIDHPHIGNPQVYIIKSNNFDIPEDVTVMSQRRKSKKKRLIEKPKEETQSEQVKTTEQVTAQAEETVKTENKYSLENVLNFNEMDLAFIGYTIRTEMDILQKQTGFFAHENQKLREEISRLKEETTTKPYMVKIQDLEYQMEVLKRNHQSELRSKDIDIERLNQKLTDLNKNLDSLRQQLTKAERSLDKAQAGRRGFSVGELAFPNEKPEHLKGS
jgi:uncharacterized protein YukE